MFTCFQVNCLQCQPFSVDQIHSQVSLQISTAGEKNAMIECSPCFKLLCTYSPKFLGLRCAMVILGFEQRSDSTIVCHSKVLNPLTFILHNCNMLLSFCHWNSLIWLMVAPCQLLCTCAAMSCLRFVSFAVLALDVSISFKQLELV